MDVSWNSFRHEKGSDSLYSFTFSPSKKWRDRALKIHQSYKKYDHESFPSISDNKSMHLARCALMLSDHYVSSLGDTKTKKKDALMANQEQELNSHLIGVSRHAKIFCRELLRKSNLPSINGASGLVEPSSSKYAWQDKAFFSACDFSSQSKESGAFIINMASTGKGKTLANAKIAYGLSIDNQRCRFNILLGLTSLTLQTADALRQRANLSKSEVAVIVGSVATHDIHEDSKLFTIDQHSDVEYHGDFQKNAIGKWLSSKNNQKINKMLSAPILVSTIDQLIAATETQKGGRHLAPIIRLLSSDTIIDEPDSLNKSDIPALLRLANWIGLFGGRLIISSATLPSNLIIALYESYKQGRSTGKRPIVCGWIDEYDSILKLCSDDEFLIHNDKFIKSRIEKLSKESKVKVNIKTKENNNLLEDIIELHDENNSLINGLNISTGLVRIDNINDLISTAKEIRSLKLKDNYKLKICVYHSRHLLLRKSHIEYSLDNLLNRKENNFHENIDVIEACGAGKEKNIIFIVLATSIAETGRDHCYDWAISDYKSKRSVIQIGGRILRHRNIYQDNSNFLLYNSHEMNYNDYLINCQFDDYNYSGEYNSNLWWENNIQWNYQLQSKTKFRAGQKNELHSLIGDKIHKFTHKKWSSVDNEFVRVPIDKDPIWWPVFSDDWLLSQCKENDSVIDFCKSKMTINLPVNNQATRRRIYSENFGVYYE